MKYKFRLIAVGLAALVFAVPSMANDGSEEDSPTYAERHPERKAGKLTRPPQVKKAPKAKRIDLNNATAAQLKKLPGGNDDEAARIIAGRPYNSKAFLVTNRVISMGRYTEIKDLIVAGKLPGQAPKPAAPAKQSK